MEVYIKDLIVLCNYFMMTMFHYDGLFMDKV